MELGVVIMIGGGAITKAVNDGDMTTEDANTLADLLKQSMDRLTPDNLTSSATFLTTACAMFN